MRWSVLSVFAAVVLFGLGLCACTGCLSLELGTKPTTITDNPEAKARIAALEERVAKLESMLQESEPVPVSAAPYNAP